MNTSSRSHAVRALVVVHNMLALYGVVNALASQGALASYERPVWPLIARGTLNRRASLRYLSPFST